MTDEDRPLSCGERKALVFFMGVILGLFVAVIIGNSLRLASLCCRKRCPPPLPNRCIDIQQSEIRSPSPACRLLHLPAELREIIFTMALGGLAIFIGWESEPETKRERFRARCMSIYHEPDNPRDVYMASQTDKIALPLLLTCRQIYLEALPTLYQHNTFYVPLRIFELAMLRGLGPHSLPLIRDVHIITHHLLVAGRQVSHSISNNASDDADLSPKTLETACRLMQQRMRLDRLTVQLEALERCAILVAPVLHNTGGMSTELSRSGKFRHHPLLNVRGLHDFRLALEPGCLPDPYRIWARTRMEQEFRAFMIGPGADEKFDAFLARQGRATRGIKPAPSRSISETWPLRFIRNRG
ncbi:hypothetical protein GGX14DRAFT_626707 [Mycena pura]|uniref:DUF7730 domain-containing protein n=1 Tax=Mycena pura TaxID=153505 RepID=A0AAD7E3D9_9AGAR|nr:hypothetical protein GGX14DRAFT_626707 [Mycena pura]